MTKAILTLLVSGTLFVLSAQQTDSADKKATGKPRINNNAVAAGVPDKADKNATGAPRPMSANSTLADTVKASGLLKK